MSLGLWCMDPVLQALVVEPGCLYTHRAHAHARVPLKSTLRVKEVVPGGVKAHVLESRGAEQAGRRAMAAGARLWEVSLGAATDHT